MLGLPISSTGTPLGVPCTLGFVFNCPQKSPIAAIFFLFKMFFFSEILGCVVNVVYVFREARETTAGVTCRSYFGQIISGRVGDC